MSLKDVDLLKRLLHADSYEGEWIQSAKVSVSPFGNFMVLASPTAAVFCLSKLVDGRSEFQVSRSYVPSGFADDDRITAVQYFPARVEQDGCKSVDFWHCVVIGYQSGWMEVVNDAGQVLAAKQVSPNQPILSIRFLSASSSPTMSASDLKAAFGIARMLELLLVTEHMIVSVDVNVLYATLISNKRQLIRCPNAAGRSASDSTDPLKSTFACKKCSVRDQNAVDVTAFVTHNVQLFDQLHLISMNRDERVKQLSTLVSYVTVGQMPFLQCNSPHHLAPTSINDLAHNVVSTVKSGLMRMATGFLWGGSSSADAVSEQQPEQPVDQEQTLDVMYAFRDHSKVALSVESSPDLRYSAVCDAHHRIIVLDNQDGVAVHLWKGYHHAQVAWTTTSWDGRKDNPDKVPADLEFGVLLVIYLPRRGQLEVWSPEKRMLVSSFAVGKKGRLIRSPNCIMDVSGRTSNVRTFDWAFLEPSGCILHLHIPVNCLTSRSSSHDSILHKQLKALLAADAVDLDKVIQTILAGKDISSKLIMATEMFQCDSASISQCELVLDALCEQLSSCPNATRFLLKLRCAVRLYRFLLPEDAAECEVNVSQGQVYEHWKMSSEEWEELRCWDDDHSDMTMSVSELIKCFRISHEDHDDSEDAKGGQSNEHRFRIHAKYSHHAVGFAKFVFHLGSAVMHRPEPEQWPSQVRLSGDEVLDAVLVTALTMSPSQIVTLGHQRLQHLYQFCFRIFAEQEGGSFQLLLQKARKVLFRAVMRPATILVVTSWRNFLDASASMNGYAVEWKQMLHWQRSFLEIQRHHPQAQKRTYCFHEVFLSGNGRVSEVMADWLLEADVPLDQVLTDDVSAKPELLAKCAELFPCSARKEILLAHLTWVQFRRWSDSRHDLHLFHSALSTLATLDVLPEVQHRLALLVWNALLDKSVRDAVNLTEIRSAQRCQRELGFSENLLPGFLNWCSRLLNILMSTCDSAQQHPIRLSYDVLSIGDANSNCQQLHLIDQVQRVALRDSDFLAIQFQFCNVANLVWHFGIDIKPLSLFNSPEINVFFHNTSSLGSLSFRLFSSEHSRIINNHRRQFLEAAFCGAVNSIFRLPESEQQLDLSVFSDWCQIIVLLAKMWHFADSVQEMQVMALYRAGYDNLAQEHLNTLDQDRQSIGKQLLRLCLQRVARFIQGHAEREKKLSVFHSDLAARLAAISSSDSDIVAEVPLKATSDLLVIITTFQMDEYNQHLAYDCLALVQALRSSQ